MVLVVQSGRMGIQRRAGGELGRADQDLGAQQVGSQEQSVSRGKKRNKGLMRSMGDSGRTGN
jgi:hypothetical protein